MFMSQGFFRKRTGLRLDAGDTRQDSPISLLVQSLSAKSELLTIAIDLTDDFAADAITRATRGKFGRIFGVRASVTRVP